MGWTGLGWAMCAVSISKISCFLSSFLSFLNYTRSQFHTPQPQHPSPLTQQTQFPPQYPSIFIAAKPCTHEHNASPFPPQRRELFFPHEKTSTLQTDRQTDRQAYPNYPRGRNRIRLLFGLVIIGVTPGGAPRWFGWPRPKGLTETLAPGVIEARPRPRNLPWV